MKSQFARNVVIRAGDYIAMHLLMLVGNFYLCQWIYARWEFEHVLDAMEALVDLVVYSYAIWALAFTIPPALIYLRLYKRPGSVLKAASLICVIWMILSDTALLILFFVNP
ncbi:hypothetical protein SAMN05216327_115130 [Dyadobacter sp. SG02]|uniref:hypothetical protein n=1 Tax=Dyadobacter sp. SG02 TaxID=1855291 RepID=UPI0008B2D633|nr:hypothetical protein [Dyadobacter sp. SG02]SEJ66284.1 hypothetical protein SAMN05216327_115130 [Dyadobacter sp. SG02]